MVKVCDRVKALWLRLELGLRLVVKARVKACG